MTTAVRWMTDLRGGRYGEVYLAYLSEDPRIELYNSYLLNECPDDLWRQLDTARIALAHNATVAVLNGPRYWLVDGIGKVDAVQPLVRDFGGIAMGRVATLEVGADLDQSFYTEQRVLRGARWHYDAGTPVYQLRAPSGRTFVMQSFSHGVDPSLRAASLGELGGRLALPDRWTYESRYLNEELVIDATAETATVLHDELRSTYGRVDPHHLGA